MGAALVATYRLQLHRGFRFEDVKRIVPYLGRLGISHLYLSPILTSREGSMHGYDGVDPSKISPERGGEVGLRSLKDHMKKVVPHMRLILDVVPNHLATSFENPMWRDVQLCGDRSQYWDDFDLRASPRGLLKTLTFPFLGDDLAIVLQNNQLELCFGVSDGLTFRYYEHRFALALRTYPDVLREVRHYAESEHALMKHELKSLEQLAHRIQLAWMQRIVEPHSLIADTVNWFSASSLRLSMLKAFLKNAPPTWIATLLKGQFYRLENWRIGSTHVNYRRFLDVNDLVALHMEKPAVFAETHGKLLNLARADRMVDGFRIDHIDGLYDPKAYLEALAKSGCNIWVEKILAPGEASSLGWHMAGTTGYEFLNQSAPLFVAKEGLQKLLAFHRRINKAWADFDTCVEQSKEEAARSVLLSDLDYFSRELYALAKKEKVAFVLNDLGQVLLQFTCALPCYRTYLRGKAPDHKTRSLWVSALKKTKKKLREDELEAHAWLTLRLTEETLQEGIAKWVRAWQQWSGAVAAKGVEDTAFYRHVAFTSLNEIGSAPEVTSNPVERFHAANKARLKEVPLNLNASSTHDTKRSEDTRARIHVLTELAPLFLARVKNWMQLNKKHKTQVRSQSAPSEAIEFLLYQTLLGVWPVNEKADAAFVERIRSYMLKAARESKLETSWITPNADYEAALIRFVECALDEKKSSAFLRELRAFAEKVALFGAINSLSMLALKIFSPGVPDFYQGADGWCLNLVDPDNRRAVDYARLEAALDDKPWDELIADWASGAIKTHLTQAWLKLRERQLELLTQGRYVDLYATGQKREHLVAFAREHEKRWLLVIAPRLMAKIKMRQELRVSRSFWEGTYLTMPPGAPRIWKSPLSGQTVHVRGGKLSLEAFMQGVPQIFIAD